MQLIGIVLAIRLFGILGGGLTIATYIVAKRKLGTPTAAVIAAAVGLIVAIVANAVLRAST